MHVAKGQDFVDGGDLMSTTIGGQGRLMLSVIEDLDCPFGLERSAKLGDGEINEDRFLAILHKSSLGSDAKVGLSRMARELCLPEAMLEMLASQLPEAEIVHFGYEGGKVGLFKIYVEFSDRVRRGFARGATPASEVVHVAVKWQPDEPRSATISRYIWPVEARGVKAIRERLTGLRSEDGIPSSVNAALEMIETARHHCQDDRIFFLEVQEDGSPRRSFDVNLYSAGLTVSSAEASIRQLADAYGIAPARLDELLSRIGSEALGHLSGGYGRNGRDFATLYFGAAARKGTGRG